MGFKIYEINLPIKEDIHHNYIGNLDVHMERTWDTEKMYNVCLLFS